MGKIAITLEKCVTKNTSLSYTYKSKKQGTSAELYRVFSGPRDEAIAKWKSRKYAVDLDVEGGRIGIDVVWANVICGTD